MSSDNEERERAAVSFQAYLDNIEAETGSAPAQIRQWGAGQVSRPQAGWRPGVKASAIVAALKEEFALGHGHAMATVALLKGSKQESDE